MSDDGNDTSLSLNPREAEGDDEPSEDLDEEIDDDNDDSGDRRRTEDVPAAARPAAAADRQAARVTGGRGDKPVGIGIAGLGFMGLKHLAVWRANPHAKVVAIADPDTRALTDRKAPTSRLGISVDGLGKLEDVARYTDPVKLAVDPAVEVVDVCAPTYEHRLIVNAALYAGRHVFCEKPLATNVPDSRRIMRRARKSRGYLMVGHCMRFWPEYVYAKEAISERRFGKVLAASFRRFSPRPDWSWQGWMLDESRSGGAVLDLHTHDIDVVRWFFGQPTAVTSRLAPVDSEGTSRLGHIQTIYHFPGGPAVTAEGGWLMAKGRPFEMTYLLVCERGTIDYDCRRDPTLVVYEDGGRRLVPEIPRRDAYEAEINYFLDCVRNKRRPEVISPQDAHNVVKIAWAEANSGQTSKRIELAEKPKPKVEPAEREED